MLGDIDILYLVKSRLFGAISACMYAFIYLQSLKIIKIYNTI